MQNGKAGKCKQTRKILQHNGNWQMQMENSWAKVKDKSVLSINEANLQLNLCRFFKLTANQSYCIADCKKKYTQEANKARARARARASPRDRHKLILVLKAGRSMIRVSSTAIISPSRPKSETRQISKTRRESNFIVIPTHTHPHLHPHTHTHTC